MSELYFRYTLSRNFEEGPRVRKRFVIENEVYFWYYVDMKRQLHIVLDIERLPEGCYLATSKDVQGLVVQAKTFEKTIEIAEDVARKILQVQKGKRTHQERIIYPMTIIA